MELDERPTEQYSDIGGLDKQIEEVGCNVAILPDHAVPHLTVYSFFPTQLVEAIVLPMTHKERFENIGIQPPKGRLMCKYMRHVQSPKLEWLHVAVRYFYWTKKFTIETG